MYIVCYRLTFWLNRVFLKKLVTYYMVFHYCFTQTIKRTIDKKTVQIWTLFADELNSVKKELSSKSPPITPMHPNYAGCAHWAKALKRRIDLDMAVLEKAIFLPHTGKQGFRPMRWKSVLLRQLWTWIWDLSCSYLFNNKKCIIELLIKHGNLLFEVSSI